MSPAPIVTSFFPNREDANDPLLDRLRSSTVGLYDVAGEIGRGGMAVVYIATDMRLGRKVAIKVMEPRLSFTPGMAERFLQEAQIAAQLQHHNIIVVHEVKHDEDLIFFVMRLVEGGSLDEICRRLAQKQRQLPIDQAQWILWQSARALAYAHSEGIVHRDIKPANILISTKGEVVVTDFGIARAVDAEGLTKSGMAIGTPTYMSPEQFVGQDPLSGASDQYALGIAAYEMLTGAPPFTGDLYRIIAAHGSAPVPDIRRRRPDCPEPLAEAVMRMLAKSPADRWPSLDAVLPVLGQGLAIDGSATRADLATIATELQAARAASVSAWGALTPVTPPWSSKGSRRSSAGRPVPATITLSPPSAQVVAGKQVLLRAVVTSNTGATIGDAVVTWTSSDPSVATVTPDGAVTGLHCGSASIVAEVVVPEGSTSTVSAVAELLVTEGEVSRIDIRDGDQVIEFGAACRFTADLFDDEGLRVGTANVVWASSRPEVMHVDQSGTALALSVGQSVVSARVGGVQGSVRVDVRAAVAHVPQTLDPKPGSPRRFTVSGGALKPSLPGSDVQPRSPGSDVKPSSPGSDVKPSLPGSDVQPSSPGSDVKPSSPGSDVKPSSPGSGVKPSLPGSDVKLNSPGSDVKLSSPGSDVKLSSPGSDVQPSLPGSDVKQSSIALDLTPNSQESEPRPHAARVGKSKQTLFVKCAVAGSIVLLLSVVMMSTQDWRAKSGLGTRLPDSTAQTAVASTPPVVSTPPAANSGSPVASASAVQSGRADSVTAANGGAPSSLGRQSEAKGAASIPPALPVQRRGQAPDSATRRTSGVPTPPVARADSPVAPGSPPPRAAEVSGPNESDMRRLSRDYVLRLERGEFRTGNFSSFFSSATSSHRAAMLGQARAAGRDGDALLVDVDVQVERTMGSGAVQRRVASVRLVLRGRSGAAVIESATPSALINGR